MNRQLDHMVRLIDDLLDVARISSGKLELKKERVNVAETIQIAIETCRPFFEQRRQVVATELDRSLFAVADPTRLTQIVGNLLHNASKFTPSEGHVRVDLTHDQGHVTIRVTDTGVGIAPEQLERVFDMFARVEQPTLTVGGGLGIGLALSRKLAEMHQGEIHVASAGVGKGSVFTFSLPGEVGVPPAVSDSVAPPPHSKPSANLNVVIIEDNRDSAEVLALALSGRGFAPSVAHDGPTGLALIQQKRPQIVLCDIGLPEMDGIEVCRRIKQLDSDYEPVMIALTGWGMKDDVRRTQESGFDHHLVKPVAPQTLFELLDRVSEDRAGRPIP